ncbi:MAG: hypothetical protein M3R72_04115 [Bacteroidota bacterium]|nr:hypothetical protein [Bacteroidota bacterium]
MVTKLVVRGKIISVELVEHVVRITIDNGLTALLQHNTTVATEELVLAIQAEYEMCFHAAFKVANKSMAVEIWGHVYAGQFAGWIKKISNIGFINKMANFVIYHAETIDIGEKGHDSNRFVWDAMAFFKPMIALFLPK